MSIASEITRLQNAKADLKTSINAKTDSQHQIDDETIDEYADFVDSIQTGGGSATHKVQLITNGIANSSYSYEKVSGSAAGIGTFTENYNNDGYAFGTARDWAAYKLSFGNLPLQSGDKIVVEYARTTAWTGTNYQYAAFKYVLTKNGTDTETDIITGKQTQTRTTLTINIADDYDNFYLAFVNLADSNNYTNYGISVYNLWVELGTDSVLLQNKEIEIYTNNTTTIISPSSGYLGLRNVTVKTNISQQTFDYIQDGLVAWFDEMEPILETDERWHSKVGNDYIYVSHRTLGSQSTNPYTKEANTPLISFANFSFSNTVDYYQTGYTWEVVGKINNQNGNSGSNSGWLITPNTQYCVGIGIMAIHSTKTNPVRLDFFNDESTLASDTEYQVNWGEYFGASVYLKNPKARGTSGKSIIEQSIHGNPFKEATQNSSTSHNNKANYMSFLSYYYNDYKASGAIRCIRIYNRKLTDAELAYNHAIDKARFNLSN